MELAGSREKINVPAGIDQLLEVRAISKRFGRRTVIHNLSLKIHAGEIIGIFGERSSGKSTVVNLLSGETSPNSGRILFLGEDITHRSPEARNQGGISRCLPPSCLFGELTVLENLLLQNTKDSRPFFPRQGGNADDGEAKDLLELVELGNAADRRVEALDLTEQSLLMVAIALSSGPSLLLLDEPAFDTMAARARIVGLLPRIAATGVAVLITARNSCPVREICDKIAVLHAGEIVAGGAPSGTAADPAHMQRDLHDIQQNY